MKIHLTCTNKGWSVAVESKGIHYKALKGGEIRYKDGATFVFGRSLYVKNNDRAMLYDGTLCIIDFSEHTFQMFFNDMNKQMVFIDFPNLQSVLENFIISLMDKTDNKELVDSFIDCWNDEVVTFLNGE